MDDPLVVNPVPSKATVNPQLDASITSPTQRQKLNTSFNSFFEEIDAKPPEPEDKDPDPPKDLEPVEKVETKEVPELPKAPVEKKTEGEPPKVEETPKTEEPPKAEAPQGEPKAETDLEKLEPHPASSEENKSHFAKLKNAAREFREKNKAWERLAPALQELGFTLSDNPEELTKTISDAVTKIRELKSVSASPEILSELDRLRGLSRSVGVLQSEEFTRDFVKPVDTAYADVITEMSKYFEASEEAIKKEFLDPLLTKFRPSQLSPEWWESQVELMTKAPAPIRRKIEQKIANVLLLQEKHDSRAKELSENKESYIEWQKATMETAAKEFESSVRDEVEKVKKEDPEVAALMAESLDGVTDKDKIEAIKRKNEKFPELERQFQSIIRDFALGPRSSARRALEFIKATEGLNEAKDMLITKEEALVAKDEEIATQAEKFQKEISTLKEDNERLRSEVKTKRQISDAPLRPSSGNGAKGTPEKQKLPTDSRKSLNSAFDDWKL